METMADGGALKSPDPRIATTLSTSSAVYMACGGFT